MKILITGGHPAPALALIDEIKKYRSVEIVFVGRKHPIFGEKNYSFEYLEVKKRGIRFIELKAGKLPRFFSWGIITNFFLFFVGFFSALKIVIWQRPTIILSFGSFLAFPIAFWAWIFRIPLFLHEQTIAPGLANRIIGFWAKKIFLSFPQAAKYFNQKKTIVSGNPIRFKELTELKKSLGKKPVIYVTGGSLGSHCINLHLEKILPKLLKRYIVIHQIGNISQHNDYYRLKNKFKTPNYIPFSHLSQEQLFEVYQKSDLVIGRAGANTFFELIALKKPALFIPLPYAASSEQIKHAQIFSESGAGEIFHQDEDSEKLLNLIDKMINNLKDYKDNLQKLQFLYQKDAAQKIIKTIFSSLKEN